MIRAWRPCRTQDYLTSYQKNIPRKTGQRHILLTLDVDTVRIKDGVPYQVRVIYVLPFLASQMQVGYIVRTTKEGGSAVQGPYLLRQAEWLVYFTTDNLLQNSSFYLSIREFHTLLYAENTAVDTRVWRLCMEAHVNIGDRRGWSRLGTRFHITYIATGQTFCGWNECNVSENNVSMCY